MTTINGGNIFNSVSSNPVLPKYQFYTSPTLNSNRPELIKSLGNAHL